MSQSVPGGGEAPELSPGLAWTRAQGEAATPLQIDKQGVTARLPDGSGCHNSLTTWALTKGPVTGGSDPRITRGRAARGSDRMMTTRRDAARGRTHAPGQTAGTAPQHANWLRNEQPGTLWCPRTASARRTCSS